LQLVTHLVWRGTHTGEVEEMQDQFAFLKQLGHAVQVAFSALIASSKLAVIVAKKPKTERGAAIASWTAGPRNATSSGR
jgi:hypothetical protein